MLLTRTRSLRRAFVVGLSDEAGAGANVGLAIKVRHAPTPTQVLRMDEYVQHTLWGPKLHLPFPVSLQVRLSRCPSWLVAPCALQTQLRQLLQDHKTFGIRAGLFWVPTPGLAKLRLMPGCCRRSLRALVCRHPRDWHAGLQV